MRHTLNELQIEDTKRSWHWLEETKCSKWSWQIEALHHKRHITTWASVFWNSCYFSATNSNVTHAFLFSSNSLHCPLTRDVGSPLTHCSARAMPSPAGSPTMQPPNAKTIMQCCSMWQLWIVSREATATSRETDQISLFFVRHESAFYFPPSPRWGERTGPGSQTARA